MRRHGCRALPATSHRESLDPVHDAILANADRHGRA